MNHNGQFQLQEQFYCDFSNVESQRESQPLSCESLNTLTIANAPVLGEDQLQSLQKCLDRMLMSPLGAGFEYPWHGLEEQLEQGETIAIAGYGSLMNRNSAARTFTPRAVELSYPVMVFNAKRVYDYIMSTESRERYRTMFPESHCGVLNSYVTGDVRDCFNAVQLELNRSDIQRFREREFGYDLLPVLTVDWNQLLNGTLSEPCMAYVLSCRKSIRAGRQMTWPHLHPHPLYHELCLDGAREISSAFLEMFHQTTRIMEMTDSIPLTA